MNSFLERHTEQIRGVLSCFDRVVLTGSFPDLCHAGAMAKYLGARQIRLFDYPKKGTGHLLRAEYGVRS